MKRLVVVTSVLLFSLTVASLNAALAQGYQVTELWSNSMSVSCLAVSKDGNYLVAVNNSGVFYFASHESGSVRWKHSRGQSELFFSVAISSNGMYVIVASYVGGSDMYLLYFNDSTTPTGGVERQPTWTSDPTLVGMKVYDYRLLDMSDDGVFAACGFTGMAGYANVTYYAGCNTRFGNSENPTWADGFLVTAPTTHVLALDLSSNGRYLVLGGDSAGPAGWVAFYKNADTAGPGKQKDWFKAVGSPVEDVAVSDDGYAVVAADDVVISRHAVYYWANAKSLSGTPAWKWNSTGQEGFTAVGLTSDGDEVVAGSSPAGTLYFWDDARTLAGNNVTETWTDLNSLEVMDVAISRDGSLIVATTQASGPAEVYFFTSLHTLIGSIPLPLPSDTILSMSGDGSVVAVGGAGSDSLTVISVRIVPSTPVGGIDVLPNYLLVLFELVGPWVLAVAACLAVIAFVVKKARA